MTAAADIRARMDKVRALMDSPNAGEAAAARARYADMQAKYGPAPTPEPVWRQGLRERLRQHQRERDEHVIILARQSVQDLMSMGYFVQDQDGEWLISPADNLARILHRGFDPVELIFLAATLPHASDMPE